jgi:diguanylate cyclase (GGDEF)-like protein
VRSHEARSVPPAGETAAELPIAASAHVVADAAQGRSAAARRRAARQRGVLLATVGMFIGLTAVLALRLLGYSGMSYTGWAAVVGGTLVVQGALLLLARIDWKERVLWDRHFLLVPMSVAAVLLVVYAYVAPEARVIILVGWIVALLFLAGLAGFREVVVLSGLMTAGYLFVVWLLLERAFPIHLSYELVLAATFFAISIYAGVVFERLRRHRDERSQLRQELARLATTDSLTDLPNRRRFEEILAHELERVARYGGSCTVALLDVDFFKNYNDTLGHVAGDRVLRQLADLMRGQVRATDVIARYGGEEFGLVMVNAAGEEAFRIVERLRLIVERHAFPDEHVQPDRRLTISGGLATCPDDATDFDALVKLADDALYAAKREGRNRVRTTAAVV